MLVCILCGTMWHSTNTFSNRKLSVVYNHVCIRIGFYVYTWLLNINKVIYMISIIVQLWQNKNLLTFMLGLQLNWFKKFANIFILIINQSVFSFKLVYLCHFWAYYSWLWGLSLLIVEGLMVTYICLLNHLLFSSGELSHWQSYFILGLYIIFHISFSEHRTAIAQVTIISYNLHLTFVLL